MVSSSSGSGSGSGSLVRLLLLRTPAAATEATAKDTPRRDADTPARRRLAGRSIPSEMSTAGGCGGCANGSPANKKVSNKRKAAPLRLARAWTMGYFVEVARRHPVPCAFAVSLLFFMGVEYTIKMVPSSSPPFDIGFVLTRHLHLALAVRPALNSALAALNTVFVGMQAAYILWTLLLEGRPRATISALFMFTCRGILGYSTQLPVPQEFLGSGADFPVANVSFFLFFSGHVAGSVIASLDMRRTGRRALAALFDALNLLQGLRLLATRGHYTIDLAAGVGAGFLFDVLAGRYEESRAASVADGDQEVQRWASSCCCACTPAMDD